MCDTNHTMKKRTARTHATMTEILRETIRKSEIPLLRLSNETGVERGSLIRFLRGDQSLRLDKADLLADYFKLTLAQRKAK